MKNTAKKGFFLLALTAIFVSGVFAQAPTLDKFKFSVPAAGKESIISAANKQISGAVVIPDTYDGRPVVWAIYAFENCTGITNAVIPNSMASVGMAAFRGCTSLESVTIGSGVTKIDHYAFQNCTSLTSVTFRGTIPTGTNFSGQNAFPGDLRAKAQAGGPGTYTRPRGSDVWTKQGGVDGIVCPHCGQLIPGAVWK